MTSQEPGSLPSNCPEDLLRTTARLSISIAEPDHDLKSVREMLSEAQKSAKKASGFSSSPFEDDADAVDSVGSQSSGDSAASQKHNKSAKRRRSSAHSIALVQGKVHKRKSKWTNEPLSLVWDEKTNQGLTMNDLRFFMCNVLGAKGPCKTPVFNLNASWKLKNVVFAFIPNLQETDFALTPQPADFKAIPRLRELEKSPESGESLPFLTDSFKYLVPTTLPESMPSLISLLLQVPLSKAAKKKRAADMSQVKLVLYDLLISQEEMERNGYPIHSSINSSEENKLEDGWVETSEFEHDGSRTFALDCEFCRAESGKVLTRISIVNFQNEVVYDQLVKPDEEIIDYVTKYSGITEELLADVTTTFRDVQEKVLSLVSSSDILIGHSLDSDLNVLKIRHPNIIDTSLLFEHHRGYPFKHALKYLAETYLARSIQNGEQDGTGHSSVEDSSACLDLVKLKLIEGPDFGRVVGQSLFKNASDTNPKVESLLVDYSMIEYGSLIKDVQEPSLVKSVVTNDDEVVNVAVQNLPSKMFQLVWFRELQYNCERKKLPAQYSGQIIDEASKAQRKKPTLSPDDRKLLLKKIDERLQRLYKEMPSYSLLVVNTGGGDPTKMNYLNFVKRQFNRQLKAGKDVADFTPEESWTFDKATELQEATDMARQGVTLITVKQ